MPHCLLQLVRCLLTIMRHCCSCCFVFLFLFFSSAFLDVNHALWLSFVLFFLRFGWLVDLAIVSLILAFFCLKHEVFYNTRKNGNMTDSLLKTCIYWNVQKMSKQNVTNSLRPFIFSAHRKIFGDFFRFCIPEFPLHFSHGVILIWEGLQPKGSPVQPPKML